MEHLIGFILSVIIGTLTRILVHLVTHGLPGILVLVMLVFVVAIAANFRRRA